MKIEERDRILKELYEKYPIEEEVSFNEFTVAEKLKTHGYLLLRYKDLYMREKSHLEHLEDLKTKHEGILYDKLKFEDERNLTKQEIEKYYIPREERIVALKELIAKQQIIVEFFEMVVKVMDKLSWNMKLFIEVENK